MELNKNNFLRWEGAFGSAPLTNIANNDSASLFVNNSQVKILPLANDVSTLGVELSSFMITEQPAGVTRPSTWNLVTSEVTFYLPTGSVPGIKTIKYKWKDLIGNESNEATISIEIKAREIGWRVYPPSGSCRIVGGVKDGYYEYSLLQKYYLDNESSVSPLVTKPNSFSDPDYEPPMLNNMCTALDYVAWPLSYHVGIAENACLVMPNTTGYTDSSVTFPGLAPGVQLFSTNTLDTPSPNGYYSDHSNWWRVFSGVIIDQGICGDIT